MRNIGRIRFRDYLKNPDGSWQRARNCIMRTECMCGYVGTVIFIGGVIHQVSHDTHEIEAMCPVIQQHNRMGPHAQLTFNYQKLFDDMFIAWDANEKEKLRLSRLDGNDRETRKTQTTGVTSTELRDDDILVDELGQLF